MGETKVGKKAVVLVVLLMTALMLVFVSPIGSQSQPQLETILIRPDGTVSPASSSIQQNGDTYTFTGNIYATIKIQKSNIILDGAGYTLSGPYNGTQADVWLIGEGPDQLPQGAMAQYTIGVDLGGTNVEGITIRNLNVENFSIGIYVWTKNNTVTGNGVSDNIVGILLSGTNNSVTQNYISNNKRGLFFGFNNANGDIIPADIIIHHNDFENNDVQLNGCLCKDYNTTEPPHSWDNGRQGNFWSDYNGTDTNGDGVGDNAYVIDILNEDRYPLMVSPAQAPTTPNTTPQLPIEPIIFVVAFIVIAIAAFVVFKKVRKKP
jgi:parallel beta-helix repeat protein